MGKKDYIPSKDEEFDVLQDNVYTAATANATQWLIATELIAELDLPRAQWKSALALYRNPATRTSAVTQQKNDAKKTYVAMIRPFIQSQLMRNKRVSDADRRAIGLPVYDRKPSVPRLPVSRPEMEIFFPQIMQHIIHVRDSELKSAAKPAHMIGFELWRKVGGETGPKFEEMQFVELATRSPHTLKYTSADRGKMVWYASRWINTRGGKGPWSEILSAIVP